jgi:hypothetical protein
MNDKQFNRLIDLLGDCFIAPGAFEGRGVTEGLEDVANALRAISRQMELQRIGDVSTRRFKDMEEK